MSVNSNGYIHLGGNIRNIYILLLLSLSYSATLLVPEEYSTIQSAIDAGKINNINKLNFIRKY